MPICKNLNSPKSPLGDLGVQKFTGDYYLTNVAL